MLLSIALHCFTVNFVFVEYDPFMIFVQLSACKHMCYFRMSERASSMYNTFKSLLFTRDIKKIVEV